MKNEALIYAQYIYYQGFNEALKLQKLLYISFGMYSAKNGNYLFSDKIEAWKYGPVIPNVYYAQRDNKLNLTDSTNNKLDDKEKKIIDFVLNVYGIKAPSLLIELTHQKNTPWFNFYKEGEKNIEIPKEAIKKYYVDFHKTINPLLTSLSTKESSESMSILAQT